ncbi:MAG: thioredoxin [bacterium]
MAQPIHITESTYQSEVLESNIPVVIDFWATWCGPCKMIAPSIEEMASEFEGKAKICKVDVDNNQSIAVQLGIRSIPTVMIFKGGKVVDTIVGAVPKAQIISRLNEYL